MAYSLGQRKRWASRAKSGAAIGWLRELSNALHTYPTLSGFLVASVVMGTAGALWMHSILLLPPFAVACCLGAFLLTLRRSATNEDEGPGYVPDRLCLQTLPVWAQQIQFASSHANDEVASLARSFAGLASRLEEATGAELFARGGRADLVPYLQATKTDLQTLVDVLANLQGSRQSIVRDVAAEAGVLQGNAEEIRQIALHARIVALNARIEAARAGEQGKAFAVVVSHMRDLATRMAQASDQFFLQTQHLSQVVQSAFQEHTQTESSKPTVTWAQELTAAVALRFETTTSDLTRSLADMRAERNDIRTEISNILVSLQFGDRTNQILCHVSENIRHMHYEMESGGWANVTEESWKARMSAKYSTAEEVQIQAHGTAAAVSSNTGITYF